MGTVPLASNGSQRQGHTPGSPLDPLALAREACVWWTSLSSRSLELGVVEPPPAPHHPVVAKFKPQGQFLLIAPPSCGTEDASPVGSQTARGRVSVSQCPAEGGYLPRVTQEVGSTAQATFSSCTSPRIRGAFCHFPQVVWKQASALSGWGWPHGAWAGLWRHISHLWPWPPCPLTSGSHMFALGASGRCSASSRLTCLCLGGVLIQRAGLVSVPSPWGEN